MIRTLLERSKSYLDLFYKEIDVTSFEHLLELCLKTKGQILFTGIGKSGFIAEKIAKTLVSFGTKSQFLDPLDLLHGDLGIIDEGDVVICMSKSGYTKELLDLVPHIKNRKAKVIACVSAKNTPLEKETDACILLPVERELDLHNLVPTTSTQVQLIFGDILSIAIMNAKSPSLELYATLHPAGSIGKKLLTKVEDLMLHQEKVPFCLPNAQIRDILIELTSKGCGCVVVADENKKLKGIFTDGDLRRSLQTIGSGALDLPIEDIMTKSPYFIEKTITAFEAKKTMQQEGKNWVNVLPIVEQEKVVGLIRLHDILNAGI